MPRKVHALLVVPSLTFLFACSASDDAPNRAQESALTAASDAGGPSGGDEGSDPLQQPHADDNVVLKIDNAALQAIRDTHPGPPIVARDLAVVHTAIFDAWAAYDAHAVGTRLGASPRRPHAERTHANRVGAVAYAGYRALVDLFPLRVSDGHGGTFVQSLIAPFWGRVTPFALTSANELVPPSKYDPFYAPSAGYEEQAEQILRYSAELTDRQKVIADTGRMARARSCRPDTGRSSRSLSRDATSTRWARTRSSSSC
jgi:hypothetical protein